MKKVRQVLIMAGGHGSRMSSVLNPKGCKSLIEYKGESIIGLLIDNIIAAGIENIVIATNTHSHQAISAIAGQKKANKILVIIADGNVYGKPEYGAVAYELRDILEDRFLIICGHHPVPVDHIKSMINSSESYRNVYTLYPNIPASTEKLFSIAPGIKRYIYRDHKFITEDISDLNIKNEYLFARNPYVMNKETVLSAHADKYQKPYADYMLINDDRGAIGVVNTTMPAEFDYDFEYFETIAFLDSQK